MVKKLQKLKPETKTGHAGKQMADSVKDSAQQIWQAGLGAFAKAQAEGSKALESLVKEGTSIQRKTQAAAEEKISEATSKMTAMAGDISSRASGHWDKLETIFEDRVAKALNKLGVPSAKDVNALIARIDELNKSVQKLSSKEAGAPKTPVTKTTTKAAPRAKAAKTAPVTAAAASEAPAAEVAAKPVTKPAVKRARKTA